MKGCTDFHSPTAAAWAHNEDENELSNKTWYFVRQRVAEPPSDFFAFTYPGQLAGWAYGMNSHGVAHSVNALFPGVVRPGAAVQFVARDVLDAASLDDAVRRVSRSDNAGGQHFNIGSLHEPYRQVSVETSPLDNDVLDPAPDGFGHANLYLRLRGSVPQPGPGSGPAYSSSTHRLSTLRRLSTPKSDRDLIEAISDRSDASFPIYRTPITAADYDGTESSVLFDAKARTVTIWTSRPSKASPIVVLRWNDSKSWGSAFPHSHVPPAIFYA